MCWRPSRWGMLWTSVHWCDNTWRDPLDYIKYLGLICVPHEADRWVGVSALVGSLT